MDQDDDLLTGPRAGRLLGVTGETIRRWTEMGLLDPVILPTGGRRYARADIEAFRVRRGGRPVDPEVEPDAKAAM